MFSFDSLLSLYFYNPKSTLFVRKESGLSSFLRYHDLLVAISLSLSLALSQKCLQATSTQPFLFRTTFKSCPILTLLKKISKIQNKIHLSSLRETSNWSSGIERKVFCFFLFYSILKSNLLLI